MCYEFEQTKKHRAASKIAEQRIREMLDNARTSLPAPRRDQPVISEKEKETVPV